MIMYKSNGLTMSCAHIPTCVCAGEQVTLGRVVCGHS